MDPPPPRLKSRSSCKPHHQARRILREKYDNDVVERKSFEYITTAAQSASHALGSVPKLSQEHVTKSIKHFLHTSWAPQSVSETAKARHTRLLVVSGPNGAGKSTVAAALADRFNSLVVEGDATHDAVAIAKTSNRAALSPLDRQIWLQRLKVAVLERVRALRMLRQARHLDATEPETIVLTCSALRREHRDALRDVLGDGSIETRFVVLQASEEELVKRLKNDRKEHYMKASMVASQLAVLKEPMVDETDVLPVDVEEGTLQDIVDGIVSFCES